MKLLVTLLSILIVFTTSHAQQNKGQSPTTNVNIHVSPDPVIVEVGKTLTLDVKAMNDNGQLLKKTRTFFFPVQLKGTQENMIFTGGIKVDSLGKITALQTGSYDIFINRVPGEGEKFTNKKIKVSVINQEIEKINISTLGPIYEGASFRVNVEAVDKGGYKINNPNIVMKSSNSKVLRTGNLRDVYALEKGKTKLTVMSGSVSTSIDLEILANPVKNIQLTGTVDKARTGDVIDFTAIAFDKSGKKLSQAPISFLQTGKAAEYGASASAQINQNGQFVAEQPGIYVISANSGNYTTSKTVEIVSRGISKKIIVKGHGRVNDQHTSDFWVWEGVDGKDYAVTGTWGSDGKAYFWEVTDPSNIKLIDSVQVDARTVNDVKVSEDGTVCVISREGASNRKNGVVILDVKNPSDVKILSTYTKNLTGGVHNIFIDKGFLYALSNGEWYEIIDISDPKNPKAVSKFELPNSAGSIHDVWIENGIAYSSNWSDGISMVDVGNGVKGGSPENPVEIGRAHVQGDANHAAFPYKSKETGKFYVIAGDEIFPLAAMNSTNFEEIFIPDGYLHFMDMTDPENPMEVARYQVPEAGSHNFWVEDDLLYVGYYNGGLRVVDISGDLMGDLYKQGREIAHYLTYDSKGFIPNAPFVWGAQPYKGHIFFSDFNSGLWSAQVEPDKPKENAIEKKKIELKAD